MKKDIKFIKDMSLLKISLEDTRKNILSLLRVRDMSISQLAEALDKDPSNINRHLSKLESAGFVMVTGERKVNNIPQKLYGRTADSFLFKPLIAAYTEDGTENDWEIQYRYITKNIMEYMNAMGYNIDTSDETVNTLNTLLFDLDETMNTRMEEHQDELTYINFGDTIRVKFLIFLLDFLGNRERKADIEYILEKEF